MDDTHPPNPEHQNRTLLPGTHHWVFALQNIQLDEFSRKNRNW